MASPFHYGWHSGADWVTVLTMPSGASQQKTRNALGRLTRIDAFKDPAKAVALNRHDYLYNAAGQRSQLTLLDGEMRAFGYKYPPDFDPGRDRGLEINPENGEISDVSEKCCE